MVFFGLVTAWRLAEAPTRISPPSWYATIEGVVRAPSLFSITLVVLPSMMATHELVVPRSMPMIFAMFFSGEMNSIASEVRPPRPLSSAGSAGRAHRDEGRPQHAVGDQVALLQDGDHGVGLL